MLEYCEYSRELEEQEGRRRRRRRRRREDPLSYCSGASSSSIILTSNSANPNLEISESYRHSTGSVGFISGTRPNHIATPNHAHQNKIIIIIITKVYSYPYHTAPVLQTLLTPGNQPMEPQPINPTNQNQPPTPPPPITIIPYRTCPGHAITKVSSGVVKSPHE